MRCAPAIALLMLASCAARQPNFGIEARERSNPISDARPGLDIADVALRSGALTTALTVVQGVLSEHPDNVDALLTQAEVQSQLGDATAAEASVRRAYTLRPGNARVLITLGKTQLRDDAGAAEASFERALATAPNNETAMTDLGVALDLQAKHRQAQAEYRKVLALESGDHFATRVDLGLSLALTGDSQEALTELRPAAAAPDVTPRVRQDLAAALALAGDQRAAETLLSADMSQEQVASVISGYEALR